ncbi:hypothetical protein EC604_23375 [Paenibacillus amylolyticus]|uniref:Uncharacterized protein n=1 Tax=Paenibacillus amylolyticus TaxID=1451 RepID=A0A5M9WZI7_PAEAM|nr:hypothetical protein EC604_23375 [Paenibacillus amylolyticus]
MFNTWNFRKRFLTFVQKNFGLRCIFTCIKCKCHHMCNSAHLCFLLHYVQTLYSSLQLNVLKAQYLVELN